MKGLNRTRRSSNFLLLECGQVCEQGILPSVFSRKSSVGNASVLISPSMTTLNCLSLTWAAIRLQGHLICPVKLKVPVIWGCSLVASQGPTHIHKVARWLVTPALPLPDRGFLRTTQHAAVISTFMGQPDQDRNAA